MVEILLPTKVRYLLDVPSSHANTIVLSHHAVTELRGRFNALRMAVISLASKFAPQSSSLGMVMDFKGS